MRILNCIVSDQKCIGEKRGPIPADVIPQVSVMTEDRRSRSLPFNALLGWRQQTGLKASWRPCPFYLSMHRENEPEAHRVLHTVRPF